MSRLLICIPAAWLLMGTAVFADEGQSLRNNKQELDRIKQQLTETRQKIDSLNQLEADLQEAVSGYSESVNRNRKVIDRTERQLNDVRKELAIEGVATIAHEYPLELSKLGLSTADLSRAQLLLESPGISVLQEAQLVSGLKGVKAMHDVTEGGLATALDELSAASSSRMLIDRAKIRILPEAEKICQTLGIDPLGLLGSGSLLIVCSEDACQKVLSTLESAGINAEVLGQVSASGRGVEWISGEEKWPVFETDEISRAFEILSQVRKESG